MPTPFTQYKDTGGGTVPGESFQICGANASTYLTSPWTYHALASGTADYTVAQYMAIGGYGTTLPPLPGYISGETSSTQAAEIVAPGAAVDNLNTPESPIIYFFEGGAYGELGTAAVNGDEYIGGSNGSFGEPAFSNGGNQGGIGDWNASYDNPSALATIAGGSALPVGTTTFTLTASRLPIVAGEILDISGNYYPVQSVSGSQSGYTITLQSNAALGISISAGTSVTYFNEFAGGVTVQYLTIDDDLGNPATFTSGAQWTIDDNKVYNGVSQGTAAGMAIYDASVYFGTSPDDISYGTAFLDGGTIEYNCLENEGHSGIHEFGRDSTFDYNEVTQVPSDTSATNGNTGDAGNKWWHTLNASIVDNYFYQDNNADNGDPIWFDNGNSGFLVQGNYFYEDYGGSLVDETGFDGDINDNMFVDNGWGSTNSNGNPSSDGAIELNQSGAWNVPGSNYNNELVVQNNILTDNWEGITIWNSGSRSCQNPQEQSGTGAWANSSYCTGGYPNGDGDFSMYNYAQNNSTLGTLTTAASGGATTIYVNNEYQQNVAIGDYVGFTSPNQAGYASTTSANTSAVTSFTGTQSLAVASTTGFPNSGNIQTAVTGSNSEGSVVGATFSYSGVSGNNLENVALINPSLYASSVHLVSGGYVQAFEPYKITAVSGSNPYTKITISPGLTGNQSAGAAIYNDGTCYDDMTSGATPATPVAPDGTSYFDGCMWEARNITIENNVENFNPSDITSGPNVWGSTAYQSCTSGNSGNFCGTNFDEYQPGYYPGGTAAGSYYTYENDMEDAFLANPNFMTPITSHWLGAPAGNDGESAWNITWNGNTYNGPVYFFTGIYGTCNLPSPWSCFVNVASWESTASGGWDNDTTSPAPTVGITLPSVSNQEIYGSSYAVDTTAAANDGGSISSCQLQENANNVGSPVTASPYDFTLDTLNYPNGTYAIGVVCTDNDSNQAQSSLNEYISNGDLNQDGNINISDLAVMAAHWGQTDSNYTDGNITGQPAINISDLAVMASNWGWVKP